MREDRKKIWTFGIVSMAILCAVYILASAACQPYRVAWMSTSAVVSARNATDQGIAVAFNKHVAKCELAHGAKTVAFKACVQGDKPYRVIVVWRTIAKPSIDSAVRATATALMIAQQAKVSNLKWQDYLLPAFCAIAKIVQDYGELFPEQGKIVVNYMKIVEGLTCKQGSP